LDVGDDDPADAAGVAAGAEDVVVGVGAEGVGSFFSSVFVVLVSPPAGDGGLSLSE